MPITPEQLKQLRKSAGLTQVEAAKLVHAGEKTWQNWESDPKLPASRKMPESVLELFCLKTKKDYSHFSKKRLP